MKKGYKLTDEHKQNISLSLRGNKSPLFGKKSWNSGKKISKETRLKLSHAKKGKKLTLEHKKKVSLGMMGHIVSESTREKMRNVRLGMKFSEEWKKNLSGRIPSLETREKMRLSKINNPNRVFKDTKIELLIEKELSKRNIKYKKQEPISGIAIVDFFIPEYNAIIQCDGDYWHNLPGRQERDKKQNEKLEEQGFVIYRFWEHQIKKSPVDCINIMLTK